MAHQIQRMNLLLQTCMYLAVFLDGLELRNNSSDNLHPLYWQPLSLSANSLLDIINVPKIICP